MARYLLFAFSDCKDPARENEFNDWYDNMHMPDMLKTPGLIRATRWMSADNKENEIRKYLALYELETDDLEEFYKKLHKQAMWTFKAGRFSELPVFDPDNVPRIYKQITKEKKGTPWTKAKSTKKAGTVKKTATEKKTTATSAKKTLKKKK